VKIPVNGPLGIQGTPDCETEFRSPAWMDGIALVRNA